MSKMAMVFLAFSMYNKYEIKQMSRKEGKALEREGLRGNVTDFLKTLEEANPSDCKRLFEALTDIVKKEGALSPLACLALGMQEMLLVFGIMKTNPYMREMGKGDCEKMTLNMKTTKKPGGGKYYSLCGRDMRDEIATFDGLLQAALVARYLSGGSMEKRDAQLALAAIAEYDETQGAE